MAKRKAPKLPQVGDVGEVDWIDSGMYQTGGPGDPSTATLKVSTAWGKVARVGACAELAAKAPGADARTIFVAHDSAGLDDDTSHVSGIWWASVQRCEVLKPAAS